MKQEEISGFSGSTFVRTVRMVCIEKHVDYQILPLNSGEDSHRALHPFMRMPIVRVGKTLLYGTLAIATYLDEVADAPRLVPENSMGRARMLQWISTCNDYLYKDVVRALLKSDDVSEEDMAVVRRDLEVADREMQDGAFLLGNEI